MHSFENGRSTRTKRDNWWQIQKFCIRWRGQPLPEELVEDTLQVCAPIMTLLSLDSPGNAPSCRPGTDYFAINNKGCPCCWCAPPASPLRDLHRQEVRVRCACLPLPTASQSPRALLSDLHCIPAAFSLPGGLTCAHRSINSRHCFLIAFCIHCS